MVRRRSTRIRHIFLTISGFLRLASYPERKEMLRITPQRYVGAARKPTCVAQLTGQEHGVRAGLSTADRWLAVQFAGVCV